MHAQQYIIAALMAFGAAVTEARALEPRQIGDLACNVARLQIVSALSATKKNVGQIQDATTKTAAQAGVKQAQDAIGVIGKAIISGDKAPASARDEVAAGLAATGTALQAGSQDDKAITDATSNLAKAAKAGQDVIAKCK
ncbi:uncharacterized protein PpBr36_06724 [Pyricularia pennisetigena]|uniref:uncharacterized protein n=1 Tax=Pyricularia pennisetigena TaxID=1578925 RepID=UPI00114FEB24|nr:uncharacterized protein PpBr36_06724 [Pyricularia pennisetigena]TLS22775.1 hypothetical protein PpBr36_06724 [Pyricularia pennisetigena]